MGCHVTQDRGSTTVEGPIDGQLRAIEADMGDMTDAFMTAAALMAVAKGTSRITNIANQRVKECNRIAVMVEGASIFFVFGRKSSVSDITLFDFDIKISFFLDVNVLFLI